MKHLLLLLLLPVLSGCYLTQAGAVRELSAERTARYQAHLTAQKEAVSAVVDALRGMDRGGMKLTLTDDGRVQAISYTEPLNIAALTKMAETQAYQEEPVVGLLSEVGDFVMKATNLAVPFASIYYGHKSHIETQRANVAITSSNNTKDAAMWTQFTTGYRNDVTSTTDTSVTNTMVTELSDLRDYESVTNNVSDVQDYRTDISVTETTVTDTTNTSVDDSSDTSVTEIRETDRDHSETTTTTEVTNGMAE